MIWLFFMEKKFVRTELIFKALAKCCAPSSLISLSRQSTVINVYFSSKNEWKKKKISLEKQSLSDRILVQSFRSLCTYFTRLKKKNFECLLNRISAKMISLRKEIQPYLFEVHYTNCCNAFINNCLIAAWTSMRCGSVWYEDWFRERYPKQSVQWDRFK